MHRTRRTQEEESQTLQRVTNSNKKVKLDPLLLKKKRKKRISKNTAYKRGRNFEYRVKKHFEQRGYYVVRKYASKGFEDLIAIKEMSIPTDSGGIETSEVFLIQCKNLKVERPLKQKDKKGLKKLAKQCGAIPLLATNPNHKLTIVEVE